MWKCVTCGTRNEDSYQFCTGCGAAAPPLPVPQTPPESPARRWIVICAAVVAVAAFAGAVLLLLGQLGVFDSGTISQPAESGAIVAASPTRTTDAPAETEAPATTAAPETAPVFSGLSVGDVVYLGSYEQDGNTANGREPIAWQVLAVQGDQALLLSRYGLDRQLYHQTLQQVAWSACDLRTWLNGSFLDTAFTPMEQTVILQNRVGASSNPQGSALPGSDTWDRVFLLSVQEAEAYFVSNEARACQPTAYTKSLGAYLNPNTGACWWYLRTPGTESAFVAGVQTFGDVTYEGIEVTEPGCVRPAIWIRLS